MATWSRVAQTGIRPRVELRTAHPLARQWFDATPGARIVHHDGTHVAIEVEQDAAVSGVLMAAVRAGGDVVEMSVHHPNLADAFFILTGRALRDEDGPRDGPRE